MNHKDYFIYIWDRMIEELKFAKCEEFDCIWDMMRSSWFMKTTEAPERNIIT